MRDFWTLIGAMVLTMSVMPPSQAFAQDPGSAGEPIKLGPVQGFADEASAIVACKPDGVVWADRRTGFYYPRFMPEYGRSPTGAFTCYQQALQADYWGFGTAGSMASKRGRNFPLKPEPFCDYKVDKKTGKGFCAQPGA